MAHASATSQVPLTRDDIRRIREGLGLTQVEAGELLGGGPRAFQKYESGAINPAATTANLLRVLEANPGALEPLTGKKAKALEAQGLHPFEVSGEHISALSERKFVLLKRRLLSAEAQANGIPRAGLHVASNLTRRTAARMPALFGPEARTAPISCPVEPACFSSRRPKSLLVPQRPTFLRRARSSSLQSRKT